MATSPNMKPPKGWHSRGYLPHFDGGSIAQTVTFHLADSLPQAVLDRWENELATMPEARASVERRQRIEHYLDSGGGARASSPLVRPGWPRSKRARPGWPRPGPRSRPCSAIENLQENPDMIQADGCGLDARAPRAG